MRTPVVLLHSLGTDAELWRHQRDALESVGPVLTLESRGHGAAPWTGGITLQDWVADLRRAIGPIGPVHLIGLSMGGMQAVAFAAAYPEMVVSLTVANSFAALPPAVAEARVAAAEAVIQDQGLAAWADTYLSETLTKPMPADDYRALRDAIAGMDVEAYLDSARLTFYGDVSSYLGSVQCPTLAIAGADDRKTPLSALEIIASGIRDARVAVIEAAGHLSCIENPKGFNQEVVRFLEMAETIRHQEPAKEALR